MRKIILFVTVFCCISSIADAATFQTTGASTGWNSSTTWLLTAGADPDNIPDANDDVNINHFVFGTSNCASRNMTIGAGGTFYTGSYTIYIYGSFTNSGTVTLAGAPIWDIRYGGTFSSTIALAPTGFNTWTIKVNTAGQTRSFSAGTTITCSFLTCSGLASGIVNNNATITVNGSTTPTFTIDALTFNNLAGSSLTLNRNISVLNGGVFNCTASTNTVRYTGTSYNSVYGTAYDNLTIDNGGTSTVGSKTLSADLTITGTLTLGSNISLNGNNRNITINGGTWQNNGTLASNNPTNLGTVTFTGATPTVLRRTLQETFNSVIINTTGTFTLNSGNVATYTGNISVLNLTLTAGTLDMNAVGNYTVTVRGNLSGNGGALGTVGLIQFTGTVAQTIGGTTPLNFTTMTVSNAAGVSTTSAQNLLGTLTVSSGTFTSNVADFTLISNTTTAVTARVAALTSGSIAGTRWVVQRRVITTGASTSTAYWGDYSSPMTSANLSDWDDEMFLSAVGGADGTSCCPIFYSVQEWNDGTGDYSDVTSLINLTPGYGYTIWTATDLTTISPFTLDTKGTPNSGSIPVSTPAADYYLVGNPYPSQILFSSLGRTNIGDYFFVLDESIQDYAVWDESTGGTGKLTGSGGVINSTQGFMVESFGAGTLTFDETDKTTTNVDFVKLANIPDLIRFHFSKGDKQVGMENKIHFVAGANNGKDQNDIGFHKSPFAKKYEVKTLTINGDQLAKNTLDSYEHVHEVPVVFKPADAGSYSFTISDLANLSAYSCVYLEDVKEGGFIDLSKENVYTFSATEGEERHFVLHFSNGGDDCLKKSRIFETIDNSSPLASVYVNNSAVVINYSAAPQKVKVVVYNSLGEAVSSTEQYFSEGQYQLAKPSVPGVYLVTITNGTKAETHKVLVD